ncbi:hypothetical protein PC9H_005286 [Pleurotus ostreatus]|uniref:Elongator complex protein 2 n=1 Tax=Pleurotus ostreatus TaxID=5322 RepID=A0A8H6ZZ98_PLEOS|nr:uncharacterized protein PC9H_005286 [Pleurotus ostreatus]KAF7433336.1 hypothetical protein PC9H_005286 [Pleurotus ostreatus]
MASTLYISNAVNRYSHAADISSTSHVAFGSTKGVSFWDTSWMPICNVTAHSSAISSLCVLAVQGSAFLIITGSSDSSVKIWRTDFSISTEPLLEVQKLPMKGKYPMALAISQLPKSEGILVLAVGGTARSIEIWTRSADVFLPSLILSGHEDWIRSLEFYTDKEDTLILASGSQDATIRLWNIAPILKAPAREDPPDAPVLSSTDPLSDELLDAFEASLGEVGEAEEGGRQISLKRHVFSVKSEGNVAQQYSLLFDALLVGHEAGITSLSWRPSSLKLDQPTLLSTSTDSSVILWSPSDIGSSASSNSASIWINRQRFGDIGGQRLGGFVGGLWGHGGAEVLAWGWGGGWRLGAVTGHNGPVKGIAWSPKGEYIISAGVDQTTRIHGSIKDASGLETWHELARPQVHGYDMVDVTFLSALSFVSIADEKVIRIFEAPKSFVDTLDGLGVVSFSDTEKQRPQAASVPALGLSNKAISDGRSKLILTELADTPASVRRPFEGELASITLWPETEKVFGHGYESIALASSTSKHLIATACRATSAEHAVVRIYDTEKYKLVGEPLQGHSLTVTRIAFSPDDRYILSVSRDRSWMLSELQPNGGYAPRVADKSHGRIIWDCAWSDDGEIFATASRDKTVRIWSMKDNEGKSKWAPAATIKTKESATSVDLCGLPSQEKRVLAIGLESGEIIIFTNPRGSPSDWQQHLSLDKSMAHVDHVYRLAWRPATAADGTEHHLASCGEDGVLKIHNIDLSQS